MAGYACNALSHSNCVSFYYNTYEYGRGPGAPLNNMSTLKSVQPCGAICSKHLVMLFFSIWANEKTCSVESCFFPDCLCFRSYSHFLSFQGPCLCLIHNATMPPTKYVYFANYVFLGKEIAAGITFIAKVFSSDGSLTFLYSIKDTGKRLGW